MVLGMFGGVLECIKVFWWVSLGGLGCLGVF